MRISLVPFFYCVVFGLCLTTTTLAQVHHGGAAQSAQYWQQAPTEQGEVYQPARFHGNASDCTACATTSTPAAYADSRGGDCSACGPNACDSACGVSSCGVPMGCDPGGIFDLGMRTDPCAPSQWFLSGWIQQGITINPKWPDKRFNGPLRYNDRANEYQLNQLYITAGRSVNTNGCTWDLGGRVDVLYGTDYFFTSALGLETETHWGRYEASDPTGADPKWNSSGSRRNGEIALYGLSLPQIYAELQAPLGLNVKVGHFYSPMGHESVMATQNFFYSHSYSMMYGEPTTLTGALFSQRILENWTGSLTGYFGLHRGWDKWDTPIDKISYLAGAKWENPCRTTSLGFLLNTGHDTFSAVDPGKSTNRFNYSLVFSHEIAPNLHYVLQHDLGINDEAAYEFVEGRAKALDGKWYSLSQYIYLHLSETLSFGCRAEYFKDENHSRILRGQPVRTVLGGQQIQSISGDEYVELALGLNWKPLHFVTLRPEVRWDWVSGRSVTDNGDSFTGPFNDNTKTNQFTIGLDLVVLF